MTAKEDMLAGRWYRAADDELNAGRQRARELCYEFNRMHPSCKEEGRVLLRELFGKIGERFTIEAPIRCDYGTFIEIGENFYANYNLTILDCAPVMIGDNVFIAPNVGIYTAAHPVHPVPRNEEWEFARPVSIGNSVWIGGSVVINPGVTIGDNVVIGSGSVVTRDIPAGMVAAGNPCRVLRPVSETDRSPAV